IAGLHRRVGGQFVLSRHAPLGAAVVGNNLAIRVVGSARGSAGAARKARQVLRNLTRPQGLEKRVAQSQHHRQARADVEAVGRIHGTFHRPLVLNACGQ
nr:hypothetical protein [Tanacetum cinerariifolium]